MTDNVLTALRAVSEGIGRIDKTKTTKATGNYKYRSIEDVLEACQPLFIEHGITVVPQVLSAESTPHVTTGKDGSTTTTFEVKVLLQYRVYGPGGMADFIDGQVYSTGIGTDDRVTGKLLSYAFKNFLFQLLCIPGAAADDNDQVGHQPVARQAAAAPVQGHTKMSPRWQALSEKVRALPDIHRNGLVDGWIKSGAFSDKRVPIFPLSDERMAGMEVAVEEVGKLVQVLADRQLETDLRAGPVGDVVPDAAEFEEMLDQAVGTPALAHGIKLLEAATPTHSDQALGTMADALGDHDPALVSPEMWDLAEQRPLEIDWAKARKLIGLNAAQMLKLAKEQAAVKHVDPPASLSDLTATLAEDLQFHVLLHAYQAGEPM